MSVLKATKKVVFEVDYNDFNVFLMDTYGGEFEFVAQKECGNDSSHSFTVEKDGITDEEEAVREGNYGDTQVCYILNILCIDGHIEEGEYLINVNW